MSGVAGDTPHVWSPSSIMDIKRGDDGCLIPNLRLNAKNCVHKATQRIVFALHQMHLGTKKWSRGCCFSPHSVIKDFFDSFTSSSVAFLPKNLKCFQFFLAFSRFIGLSAVARLFGNCSRKTLPRFDLIPSQHQIPPFEIFHHYLSLPTTLSSVFFMVMEFFQTVYHGFQCPYKRLLCNQAHLHVP